MYTRRKEGWLFRGQSVREQPLPRFFRLKPLRSKIRETEAAQLSEFRKKISGHSEGCFDSDWSVLTLIQHFEGYTRLLDWTYNPLVALWFAISGRIKDKKKKHTDERAVVWLVNPTDGVKNGWPNERPKDLRTIRFFEPERIDARVLTQASVLGAHPVPTSHLSMIMKFGREWQGLINRGRMAQVQVADSALRRIRTSLSSRGVTSQSIFPRLGSIARVFKEEYEALPPLEARSYTNSIRLS